MPQIVAGLIALTALAASIFAGLDSVSCLIRGGIAYAVGLLLANIWMGLVYDPRRRILNLKEEEHTDEPEEKVENQPELTEQSEAETAA